MSTDRLRDVLRNSTEHVDMVELTESAMKQSRQMTVRRATVGATLAVIVLAGGIFGAANFWPKGAGDGVDVAVSGSPSVSASPAPEVSTSEGGEITPLPKIEGTFFYVDYQGKKLLRWTPGGGVETVATGSDEMWAQTVNISPDGRRASWVSYGGKLQVAELDGGRKVKSFGEDLHIGICDPVWIPGTNQILAQDPQKGVGTYDADTGEFRPRNYESFAGCYTRVVSIGGKLEMFYITGDVKSIVRQDYATGKVIATYPTILGDRRAVDLVGVAVSPQGVPRLLVHTFAANSTLGDAGRALTADRAWDITADGLVSENFGMEGMDTYVGLDNGNGVLRSVSNGAKVLRLLGPDQVFDEKAEPSSLKNFELLAYIP